MTAADGPARTEEQSVTRQPLAPLRSDFPWRFHDEAGLEPLREATLRLLDSRRSILSPIIRSRGTFPEGPF